MTAGRRQREENKRMSREDMAGRIAATTVINAVVLAGFAVLFLARRNYEFIVYASSLVVAIALIEVTGRKFAYSLTARAGFSVWMFLHLAGGAFSINGERIYDTMLLSIAGKPYDILKFDQAIHAFCYFVITLFLDAVVRHLSRKDSSMLLSAVIVVLAAMGISALNEVIEFATVVFFGAKGVGGYYNNALDLVFNLIGILAAAALCTATKRADSPSSTR